MTWQTVIGLEVHVQLKTHSKLFSPAPTGYGAPANGQTNYIDAALPGTLPVLNQEAVHMAIQFALAIGAPINQHCFFERKNYFYPDLPKGYQISQAQCPIVSTGHLNKVEIIRAHLEEDAGKSLHDRDPLLTGIDLNRAGTALLEIVTSACLSSAQEALTYLKTLHQLVVFLGICDGNMQEGSFRCDVNISLKPQGQGPLGTRVELKNLNSFRFIEKAIAYEEWRQQMLLEQGKPVIQETRLYNPSSNCTEVLRQKEDENDYRYFPDPDLLPLQISDEDIASIRARMPETPQEIATRLATDKHLSADDIQWLLSSPAQLHCFDALKKQSLASSKTIINWLKGPYAAILNERQQGFEAQLVPMDELVYLLDKIEKNECPKHLAKSIFLKRLDAQVSLKILIEKLASPSAENTKAALEKQIQALLAQYPEQVAEYRSGKEKLLSFFVGLVMKQCKGQANPEEVHAVLRRLLQS
jgi:aspartyl-tRNA(Asn)/glutamyl-tRNA(Gln) amidotransferase subunit B